MDFLHLLAFLGLIGWIVWTTTYLFPGAQVTIAAAIACALGHRLLSGRLPDYGGRVGLWLFLFLCAAMLSTLSSIWLGRSVVEVKDLAKVILVFFLTVNVAEGAKRIRWTLWVTVALLAFFPARGAISAYLAGAVKHEGRADWMGFFGNANALASVLVLFLPLPAIWFRRSTRWPARLFWGGCAFIMLVAVILTKSRSGFLGLVILLAWMVWAARNRLRAAGFLVVVALVLLAVGPASWQTRMASMYYGISGREAPSEESAAAVGSWESRLNIWRAGLRMVVARPLLGMGPGTFEEAHRQYQDPSVGWREGALWQEAHNSFLRIFAEMGLAGILAFLGALIAGYSMAFRALRTLHRGGRGDSLAVAYLTAMLAGLTAFLATNLFNTFYYLWYLYMHLGLIVLLVRHVECLHPTVTYPAGRRPVRRSAISRGSSLATLKAANQG